MQARLARLQRISLSDFAQYAQLHNTLLLGGPGSSDGAGSGSGERLRGYLPAGLHFVSKHCKSLRELHLELPAPPMPISVAAGRAPAAPDALLGPAGPAAAAAAAAAAGSATDGFLVKLIAQARGCG